MSESPEPKASCRARAQHGARTARGCPDARERAAARLPAVREHRARALALGVAHLVAEPVVPRAKRPRQRAAVRVAVGPNSDGAQFCTHRPSRRSPSSTRHSGRAAPPPPPWRRRRRPCRRRRAAAAAGSAAAARATRTRDRTARAGLAAAELRPGRRRLRHRRRRRRDEDDLVEQQRDGPAAARAARHERELVEGRWGAPPKADSGTLTLLHLRWSSATSRQSGTSTGAADDEARASETHSGAVQADGDGDAAQRAPSKCDDAPRAQNCSESCALRLIGWSECRRTAPCAGTDTLAARRVARGLERTLPLTLALCRRSSDAALSGGTRQNMLSESSKMMV